MHAEAVTGQFEQLSDGGSFSQQSINCCLKCEAKPANDEMARQLARGNPEHSTGR